MGSGSEVHCLIWCGNLFLSKRMRGACKWDIGLCLGLLLFCCHQVSLNLRLGSLQGQWREPPPPPGLACGAPWLLTLSRGPGCPSQFPHLSRRGEKCPMGLLCAPQKLSAQARRAGIVQPCPLQGLGPSPEVTGPVLAYPAETRSLLSQTWHFPSRSEQPPPCRQEPSPSPPSRKEIYFLNCPVPLASQMDSVFPYATPETLRPGSSSPGGSWGQEASSG